MVGSANVYRVVPGEPPQLFRTDDACLGGLSFIVDLTFDQEGNLYVLQFASGAGLTGPGALIRDTPDPSASGGICAQYRASTRMTVVGGLIHPTSVAIGPDGAFYVSNNGNSADVGEVLRIAP